MAVNLPNHNRSHRSRRWFATVTVFFATTLAILVAEGAMRFVGFSPLRSEIEPFKVDLINDEIVYSERSAERNNQNLKIFRPDPTLGYTHLPGKFNVTLNDGFEFTMHHDEDTLRITRPIESGLEEEDLPELWVFGCSFTHGWSVNDEETFPWQLQELMPGYMVTNYGVGGYDQVHALMQLEAAIASKEAPRLAIVTYAHFHDERNTFGHAFRKSTVANISPFMQGVSFPYARLGERYTVVIHRRSATFWGLPLLRSSALADSVDLLFERADEQLTRRHDVSKSLILEISRVCQKHGVELIVAGITQEPATWDIMAFCLRHGIHQVDITFDHSNPIYMNAPHDPTHPSPAGHRAFALRLADFLGNPTFSAELGRAKRRQVTRSDRTTKKESVL